MYSRFLTLAVTTAALMPAQTAPVRVLSSNGVRAVVEALKPQCERNIGRRLEIQYGSTTDLLKKIDSGEAFDLTLLTTDAIDRLERSGKIMPKPAEIARCGVGVGVRAGAPKPDISTPEAMKRALLQTKSVTFAEDGASRRFVEAMFEHFGIAGQMKPKIVLAHGSGTADALVADGKAGMVLTLASEILPAPGLVLVGPLPEQVQGYITFGAGISTKSANGKSAAELTRFLRGPDTRSVYQTKGMEAR